MLLPWFQPQWALKPLRKTDVFTNLVFRAPTGIASRLRIAAFRLAGARIAKNCRLGRIQLPRNPWDIELGQGVALEHGVILLSTGHRETVPRIKIGERTYVNRFTMFDACLGISVGCDTMIGPYCYITDHDHGTEPSTLVNQQDLVAATVSIGENVWIGAGVSVLKGVKIGSNSVVGAGSVVTRDVRPGERVAGVPAAVLARGI